MKITLSILAITFGVGSAFATKPAAQRNIYQLIVGRCTLIPCTTIDRGLGRCSVAGTLYLDSACSVVYTGAVYIIANP